MSTMMDVDISVVSLSILCPSLRGKSPPSSESETWIEKVRIYPDLQTRLNLIAANVDHCSLYVLFNGLGLVTSVKRRLFGYASLVALTSGRYSVECFLWPIRSKRPAWISERCVCLGPQSINNPRFASLCSYPLHGRLVETEA